MMMMMRIVWIKSACKNDDNAYMIPNESAVEEFGGGYDVMIML